MTNIKPHYDGITYHSIETSPGLYFNTVEFKKDKMALIVVPDTRWVSAVVLNGTLEICECENSEFIQTFTSEVTNNYISFPIELRNETLTYRCSKNSVVTFVIAVEQNDSHNIKTQYHYWTGDKIIPAGYGMFVVSGTVTTDSATLEKWDYQLPRDYDREITCQDSHVVLVKRLVEKDLDSIKMPDAFTALLYNRMKNNKTA
jgi:hypothetical protein